MKSRFLLALIAACGTAACMNDAVGTDTRCDDPGFVYTQRGDTAVSNSTLRYLDLVVGTGSAAEICRGAAVRYVGRVGTGAAFDSTPSDTVFKFTPGLSNIIPGFAEGVLGMRVGGKRRVIIPPALGYGNAQNGPIPPNSTLTFDITLVRVEE